MVKLFAMHRPHQQKVIGAPTQTGQQFTQLHARLAIPIKSSGTRQQRRARRFDKCETRIADHFTGECLALQLSEFGFWIKQIQLRRPTRHEHKNTGLGARPEMGGPGMQGGARFHLVTTDKTVGHQERSYGRGPHATGTARQECTPRSLRDIRR